MAFRERNKNTGIDNVAHKIETSEISGTPKNQHKDEAKAKTFRDQAVEVIKILRKQGIDIYDKNRKPGMYLKRSSSVNDNVIKGLLEKSQKSQGEQQTQETPEKDDKVVNGLLNFFTNKE